MTIETTPKGRSSKSTTYSAEAATRDLLIRTGAFFFLTFLVTALLSLPYLTIR